MTLEQMQCREMQSFYSQDSHRTTNQAITDALRRYPKNGDCFNQLLGSLLYDSFILLGALGAMVTMQQ